LSEIEVSPSDSSRYDVCLAGIYSLINNTEGKTFTLTRSRKYTSCDLGSVRRTFRSCLWLMSIPCKEKYSSLIESKQRNILRSRLFITIDKRRYNIVRFSNRIGYVHTVLPFRRTGRKELRGQKSCDQRQRKRQRAQLSVSCGRLRGNN